MLTTVQDLGRWGHQSSGISVAGPMDAYSHRFANTLVGNPRDAAALEVTLIGPVLRTDAALTCAITGARFDVTVDDVPVMLDTPFEVPSGSCVRFGRRGSGARATLAVRGGLAVPLIHGSRSTCLSNGMGPFGGRPLVAGDLLPVHPDLAGRPGRATGSPLSLPGGGASLRVVEGPHAEMFDAAALAILYGARFVITPSSNRMGYRLSGPNLRHVREADVLSAATPIGSLQVPASGQVILLMADRQTTGGYPRIATVITADLPIAGQLAPGDWVEFRRVTGEEATAALRGLMACLEPGA
jgi:antagonist of KipI